MEHLLTRWNDLSRQISGAGRVVLLSDFDGTLSPIVEDPGEARMAEGVRRLLRLLASTPRYCVGVVSGRGLADLRERVDIPGAIYAGNHGLEVDSPGLRFLHPVPRETVSTLRIIEKVLAKGLRAVKGAVVENKGLTLSVHYRSVAPEREAEVRGVFQRTVGVPSLLGRVRVTRGKKVYEVRPNVNWDKGKAVAYILSHCAGSGGKGKTKVVFLGDDLTDEDAFLVVNSQRGLSVRVGEDEAHSAARYRLCSVAEVERFLELLVSMEWEARGCPA